MKDQRWKSESSERRKMSLSRNSMCKWLIWVKSVKKSQKSATNSKPDKDYCWPKPSNSKVSCLKTSRGRFNSNQPKHNSTKSVTKWSKSTIKSRTISQNTRKFSKSTSSSRPKERVYLKPYKNRSIMSSKLWKKYLGHSINSTNSTSQ
jgi:hypothetical protein